MIWALPSLQMPCLSCRPFSQTRTLTAATYLLLLPTFAEAMQSPCSGVPPTATCPPTGAEESTTKEHVAVGRSTSYPEEKIILKTKQHSKWRPEHPQYSKTDRYNLMTRRGEVTVFRIRTGHNRLNCHLPSELRSCNKEQCPCTVLAVRQLNICCSPVPFTSCSGREFGQTTPPWPANSTAAWGIYDVPPPYSRRLEFRSDKRQEENLSARISL